MADYMTELAGLTGLRHFPNQGPFGKKEGTVIGERDGYLLAIGPGQNVKNDQQAAINVMIRFRAAGDAPPFTEETFSAAFESAGGSKKGKNFDFGADYLACSWGYTFGKHKAEEVKALADALLEATKTGAQPFAGKCEVCANTSVSEILLFNSVPGLYCTGCQESLRRQAQQAGQVYETMEMNFMRGFVFALAVALACSLAWGLVAYAVNRIFLWAAIGIGFAVGWAFIKGAGKIDTMGRILVALLTVASVLFGDVIFFTLSVMKETQSPFSFELLRLIIANFWEIERESGGGWVSILFAVGGAAYALYVWRKPKFEAMFEPLGGSRA
jgi:hypothetical protein